MTESEIKLLKHMYDQTVELLDQDKVTWEGYVSLCNKIIDKIGQTNKRLPVIRHTGPGKKD